MVILITGVARIVSRGHFFPYKSWRFLLVAFKRRCIFSSKSWRLWM